MLRPLLAEYRQLLPLALPIIGAQLVQQSMGFIDTLMVGRLGEQALAALAIAVTLWSYILTSVGGILIAINPLVSQALAKTRKHHPLDPHNLASHSNEAGTIAMQGLWLALGFSIPVLLLLSQAEPLLRMLRQTPEMSAYAQQYLSAVAWGTLPAIVLLNLRAYLEGLARPLPLMLVTTVGAGLNVALNTILMFGYFGLPALGLAGTGWATAIVFWMMLLIALFYIHWRGSIPSPWAQLSWQPKIIVEIVRVGSPIALTIAAEIGMFSAVTFLMGQFGETALAAQRIAMQSIVLSFMVPLGISVATTSRVAKAVGESDAPQLRRSGNAGIILAMAFMVLTALLFWLRPLWVVSWYLDPQTSPEVARLASRFLLFAAIFQLVDGLQVAAVGSLRGLKDTAIPMVMTMICYWVIGLGSGVLLAFRTPLGHDGLWIGLIVGLSSAALALLARWHWRSRQAL